MREIQEKKAKLNLGKARAAAVPLRMTQKMSVALIFTSYSFKLKNLPFLGLFLAEENMPYGLNRLVKRVTQRRQIK
jgi:hypothetical protein